MIIVLASLYYSITLVFASDFSGSVVCIIDGDSIRVLHNGRAEEIRLNSIDCPEKGQAYGKKAKQAASELAFRQEVTVESTGKDRFGRTLGTVMLPDGKNLNHELVKGGWCWWYRKYAPGDVILEELERRARASGLGLWADPHPVPPWEWRKRK